MQNFSLIYLIPIKIPVKLPTKSNQNSPPIHPQCLHFTPFKKLSEKICYEKQ